MANPSIPRHIIVELSSYTSRAVPTIFPQLCQLEEPSNFKSPLESRYSHALGVSGEAPNA